MESNVVGNYDFPNNLTDTPHFVTFSLRSEASTSYWGKAGQAYLLNLIGPLGEEYNGSLVSIFGSVGVLRCRECELSTNIL